MKQKVISILELLVLIAAGFLLIIHPGGTMNVAVTILGIALLCYGAFSLISYFAGKEDRSVVSVIAGAIAVIFGIVVLTRPDAVISFFPTVAGIVVIASGVRGILRALEVRKADPEGGYWKAALILAAIDLVLGIIVFANPFGTMEALVKLLGVVLLYIGVTGIIAVVKA